MICLINSIGYQLAFKRARRWDRLNKDIKEEYIIVDAKNGFIPLRIPEKIKLFVCQLLFS